MPKITLIVCVYGDRVPLARLLARSVDCYDELLVIHDEPDFEDVASLVQSFGGRFMIRPRAFSQEPHIPFALGEASNDWILRFDADEYPSAELRDWLIQFREAPEPESDISDYRCIWPAWDGARPITKRWPNNRLFLFHRQRVQMIGVSEQGIMPEGRSVKIPLTLCHEPAMRTHGLKNLFAKNRTMAGRKRIVNALLGSPLDHPRWRYESAEWPLLWEQIRRHPLLTLVYRLLVWPLRQACGMVLARDFPRPSIFMHAAIFHTLVCWDFWKTRRRLSR
jgi:hypothetical protein